MHPATGAVLWHYFLEAPNEKIASESIGNKVIAEHSNGFLLDTGGSFIQIVEEDKEGEDKITAERIAAMSDEEVYALSAPVPNQPEEISIRLSHRRFMNDEERQKCFDLLRIRFEKIKQ